MCENQPGKVARSRDGVYASQASEKRLRAGCSGVGVMLVVRACGDGSVGSARPYFVIDLLGGEHPQLHEVLGLRYCVRETGSDSLVGQFGCCAVVAQIDVLVSLFCVLGRRPVEQDLVSATQLAQGDRMEVRRSPRGTRDA